jgi:hypothetical protein
LQLGAGCVDEREQHRQMPLRQGHPNGSCRRLGRARSAIAEERDRSVPAAQFRLWQLGVDGDECVVALEVAPGGDEHSRQRGDGVAALDGSLGERAAEAARGSGDQPNPRHTWILAANGCSPSPPRRWRSGWTRFPRLAAQPASSDSNTTPRVCFGRSAPPPSSPRAWRRKGRGRFPQRRSGGSETASATATRLRRPLANSTGISARPNARAREQQRQKPHFGEAHTKILRPCAPQHSYSGRRDRLPRRRLSRPRL